MIGKKIQKAQIASIIATLGDYICLIVLVEALGIWSVIAAGLSSLFGAVIHFNLSRSWIFEARGGKLKTQITRYFLVAVGSSLLNSLGVYFLNRIFLFPYLISKTITALVVALGYNFVLHYFFVFR